MQIGAKFDGSPTLQTSVANQELIPKSTVFYKFSFMPSQDCTVKINGSDPILIRPGLGFSTNEVDAYIGSFIIVEPDVEFHWLGGAR